MNEYLNDMIIQGEWVITLDKTRRMIRNGAVVINDGKIAAVGRSDDICQLYVARKTFSGKGKMVLPGMINAHVHTLEQLERGMADELPIFPWIFERTLPYEAALTPDEVYFSSLLCCAEMIRSGITTIAEVGAHPHYYHETARAIEDAGMRAIIGKHGMDAPSAPVPGPLFETTAEAVKSAEKLITALHGKAGGRIRGSAVVTTMRAGTSELFQKSKRLADECGVVLQVHMNLGHGQFIEAMRREYGGDPIQYLDRIGVLGPNVLLVHMSYPTTPDEISILRKQEVKICHCPGAALHGGYGVSLSKIPEFVDAGLCVGLGTDGAPSCNFNDILRTMYLAAGIHKDVRMDPGIMPPEKVLEMATIDGARALEWEDEIGSLEVGKRADLAIFDTHRPEWQPLLNPVSNLVYSATGDSCETVIIDGKVVMENGRLHTIDEDQMLERATETAREIANRAGLHPGGIWPKE